MDESDKKALLVLGGVALLGWLFSGKHAKCGNCNYPVTDKNKTCPNCGQMLDWSKF
jgi:hypothetical protein